MPSLVRICCLNMYVLFVLVNRQRSMMSVESWDPVVVFLILSAIDILDPRSFHMSSDPDIWGKD